MTPTPIAIVLAAAPTGSSAMQVQSIWDFMVKGGFMMIPIGICSLVALAVIAERVLSLSRSRVIPRSFVDGLRKVLADHPGDKVKALAYCKRHPSPLANVFAAGIKRLGDSIEVVEKHIEEAGEREVVKLRKFLRVLSVIAAIAPLLGLLGTILGMIKAFQTVALSAEALGKAEMLAGGIYEAMITTAAGLSVAIPVLVCYHWISSKIDRLVMEMDQTTFEFVEQVAEQHVGEKTAPAPVPAPGPRAVERTRDTAEARVA